MFYERIQATTTSTSLKKEPVFKQARGITVSLPSQDYSARNNTLAMSLELMNDFEFVLEIGNLIPLSGRLTNPRYGTLALNQKLWDLAKDAPSVERVWQITEKKPSLLKLLSDDREANE